MGKSGKDSDEVIKFMTLFALLKEWSDNTSQGLVQFAANDSSVKRLCIELADAAFLLNMNERRARALFAAPVDPAFLSAWRDYEERYQFDVAGVWLSEFLPAADVSGPSRVREADLQWDNANYEAEEQARGIEDTIKFAQSNADHDWRWEDQPEFIERILDGIAAWDRLKQETGFDLKGVFRRRALIPFVLVPRDVAAKHGSAETISMLRNLQQAQEAFVFGATYGAIALMRSILESVLRDHYSAEGKDLCERINSARVRLPAPANKASLHRLRKLANAILHLDPKEDEQYPSSNEVELEKDIVRHLLVLRALIEGVK